VNIATLSSYLRAVLNVSAANQLQTFLRIQFIRDIKDSSIREKLLQETDIEFQAVVDKALALEMSRLDNQKIKKANSTCSSNDKKKNKLNIAIIEKIRKIFTEGTQGQISGILSEQITIQVQTSKR